MTTIFLAEDHDMVREGLQALLAREPDLKLIGEAKDGLEAWEKVELLKPNILLLDLTLPRMHGLHVLRKLHGKKRTRVIVLTMHSDQASMQEAIRQGAMGYVLKSSPGAELIRAIRSVQRGEISVPPIFSDFLRQSWMARLSGHAKAKPVEPTLRENMVLQQIAEGHGNEAIGARLGISVRTVEKHRGNIMNKLGLKSERDLIVYAFRAGGNPAAATPP